MPTTDFSQVPDDQMEHIFGLLENNANFIPNVTERRAFVSEYFRRQNGAKPAAPAPNVENDLDAASTPIEPDPSLKQESPADVMRRRMRAAGYPEQSIESSVRQEAGMPHPFAVPSTDAGLARGVANLRAADAMEQRIGEAYATPAPAGPSRTVRVDGYDLPSVMGSDGQPLGDGQYYTLRDLHAAQSAEDDAFRRAGGRRGVPGPRTDDGRSVSPGPEFSSPDEAEAYYTRPTDPQTGQLMPSPADRAMMARGYVPVYSPAGEVTYRMAANYDGPGGVQSQMSPWAQRQASYYEGRELQREDGSTARVQFGADGLPAYDPRTGQPKEAPMERVEVRTPFGPRMVLVPTQASRERAAAQRENASIDRIAATTGRSAEELAKMSPEERARVLRANYDAETQRRRDLVARNAALAGGSQNLNAAARARIGTMRELGSPDLNDWQRLVLAETMLRAPQTMTPLGVQAVGAQNAMRMMTAEGLAGMDPMRLQAQGEAREAQYDALTPEQQTVMSIRRKEPMGTGRSTAHVQSRWNYWMNNVGPRPESYREQNFRAEMEGIGYQPGEIDRWIDARRNGSSPEGQSPAASMPGIPSVGAAVASAAFPFVPPAVFDVAARALGLSQSSR